MEDFLNSSGEESNFKFDEDQVSWTTIEFLKLPAKSLSFIFILFVLISFIVAFIYMSLSRVAITIHAPSIISSKTPLVKTTSDLDIKIEEIAARNGQSVQKGQAIIFGEDRIRPKLFLKYKDDTHKVKNLILEIEKKKCSDQCLKSFRENSLTYFRYLSHPRLNKITQKIREELFILSSSKDPKLASSVRLLLFDLAEMIDFIQREQVIHAPESGIIQLSRDIAIGSYVKNGTTLFEIIPEDNRIQIKSYVKGKDITKIKKDMIAQITINAYPPRKFGLLEGKVTRVGVTKAQFEDSNDYYEIEINLTKDYFEKNNKKYQLLLGMKGESIFITKHTTLLKKYFGKIAGIE